MNCGMKAKIKVMGGPIGKVPERVKEMWSVDD